MGRKLQILIVEDEFISRILLKEILEPFGNCHLATDGKEALAMLEASYVSEEKRYDLVCLDIMMPQLSGHEVLKKMRNIEDSLGIKGDKATKVVMVTALDDAQNVMEAVSVGRCQAYLTKPVSRSRIEEQLTKLKLTT